jgi:hypothetical protein
MKAWEEKRRVQLYQKKISQAKAVVKTGASSPAHTPAKYFDLVPLDLLVKNFDLMPYRRKLKEEGFEGSTNRFLTLTPSDYSTLLERLKVLPGHKAKFDLMLDYLSQISTCSEDQQPAQRRVQSAAVRKRQPPQPMTSYSIMKSPVSLQIPCRTAENFSLFEQDSTKEEERRYSLTTSIDEFEALEQELIHAQRRVDQVHAPTFSQQAADIRDRKQRPPQGSGKANLERFEPTLDEEVSQISSGKAEVEDPVKASLLSIIARKSDDDAVRIETSLSWEETHEAKPIEVIQAKVAPFTECTGAREGTGLSIDSWKIHATPSSLDIEEMSHCLSEVLRQHLTHPEPSSRPFLPPAFAFEFERVFIDVEARTQPEATSIYNFCKNVMWRSQMEREVVVVCLVYLSRLCQKTGLRLTPQNWKRLAFIALTVSSKVWDDESFENQHFAQAFSLFSADEINSMESVFLTLLDFQLKVTGSEFTSFYLLLHSYARPGMSSCGAADIDLTTLQRLEKLGDAGVSFKAQYGEALLKTM